MLFKRPRREVSLVTTACVPYGEADLLIGLDQQETLRAIDPSGPLRVANLDRTSAAVNLGVFADEHEATPPQQLAAALRAVTSDGQRLLEDFSAAARATFHTDRVTDVALVGAAFQLGFVPVSLEAVETAVGRIESRAERARCPPGSGFPWWPQRGRIQALP